MPNSKRRNTRQPVKRHELTLSHFTAAVSGYKIGYDFSGALAGKNQGIFASKKGIFAGKKKSSDFFPL